MALLQDDKAIFYHPLNDAVETIKAKTWTLVTKAPTFAAGKIGSAMFPTASTEPTYGAEKTFLTGGVAQNISCAKLTSTQVVIVYQDQGDSSNGKVKLATISGSDVTIGGPTTFLAAGLGASSVAALSSTKYVIAYRNGGSSSDDVIVGELSGTVSTFGSAVAVNASSGGSLSVTALDSSKAVVGYRDGVTPTTGHGKARVVTVSGLDATVGPEKEFHSSTSVLNVNLTALDSSKFVIAYRNSAGAGTGVVGTVSGTDITFGSDASFTTSANQVDVERLTATAVVVCYGDAADSGHGTAKVGAVSGTDLTWGAETEFESTNPAERFSVTAMTSTRFVVAYRDEASGAERGASKLGTVSGTGITFGSQVNFQAADTFQIAAAAASPSTVLVAYSDSDFAGGSVRLGEASVAGDLSGLTADYDSAAGATKVAFAGWLKNPSA